MWELDHKEGWALKNWCSWIMVLDKTLESPLDARKSNQSILKGINPESSLEGLMLKLQYFGYLMGRAKSLEKTLTLGKIEGRRRRGWQRMRWLDSNTDRMDMNLSNPWVIIKDRGAWWAAVHGSQRVRHNLVTKQQQQPACIKMLHGQPPFPCEELLADSLCKKPKVCIIHSALLRFAVGHGLRLGHVTGPAKIGSPHSPSFLRAKRMDRHHTLGGKVSLEKRKEMNSYS